MTSSEILQQAMDAETSPFDKREPRVSKIGLCARRQVLEALGVIDNDIPWEFCEAGHILQYAAFQRVRSIFPFAEEEVAVETPIKGVYCHPDIVVLEENLCIQVKSSMAARDSFETVASYQRDQVLMEWVSWRHSRKYVHYNREDDCYNFNWPHKKFVPSRYEILFLDRETYGKIHTSVNIPWDGVRARELQAKFEMIADCIAEWMVPPIPKTKQADCWLGQPCQIYNQCWKE